MCVIIIFVKFLIQPYLLLFLDFNGDTKLRLFQLFWLSIKLIHLHYNWQQNLNKKFGDILRSVPTYLRGVSLGHKIKNYRYYTLSFNLVSEYEKSKDHKVCVLWSLVNYSQWKVVHDNKNDDFLTQLIIVPHLAILYWLNSFMTKVPSKQKLVHWFAKQCSANQWTGFFMIDSLRPPSWMS